MDHVFHHEQLDAYRLARDVARWFRRDARFPRGEASLRDQAKRAADSVVLNLAEGCYRAGKDRAHHVRIAAGSAWSGTPAECCAVLDLVDIAGSAERQQELRRVAAMLQRLK